jgi:hypothetical protein
MLNTIEKAVTRLLRFPPKALPKENCIKERAMPDNPIKAMLIVENISLIFNLRDELYLAHDVSHADLLKLSKNPFIIAL